ncbi:MAG: DUF115 domain-containing protein [Zetaproteobacteria bacterium]|nr:DUF115 domain-containing protein [Zetaproteobacteria bacterium]
MMIRDKIKTHVKRMLGGASAQPSPTPRIHTTVPHYVRIEEPAPERADRAQIASFRDKYIGKRCFIVGNGPSLRQLDLSKLRDEYSFGVNSIFLMQDYQDFRPTFYVVEDIRVMHENVEAINQYQVPYKFFPTEYIDLITHKENCLFFNMNRGFYENCPNFQVPRFSTDCAERIYCGQSVTTLNLQLAFFMGFAEIYLIGMDFEYHIPADATVEGNTIRANADNDPNHFHPAYFGKGKHWHNPRLDLVEMNYQLAKMVCKNHQRKIYNATAGGKLEVFERVDYAGLFSDS